MLKKLKRRIDRITRERIELLHSDKPEDRKRFDQLTRELRRLNPAISEQQWRALKKLLSPAS